MILISYLSINHLKKIISYVNHDLALITDWLRANKISLNAIKTKVLIYKPKTKKYI